MADGAADRLYKFDTDQPGEMSLRKDDLVEPVTKDDGGWWLVKKGTQEGWVPTNVSHWSGTLLRLGTK